MLTERRTPTRTAIDKFDEEEGVKAYGFWGWVDCVLKSQEPHDSSRNIRNREKDENAKKKKSRQEQAEED